MGSGVLGGDVLRDSLLLGGGTAGGGVMWVKLVYYDTC